jgi:hypothetical protein
MTTTAKGTFEVKMTPQPADESPAGATIGRMTLDKTFHGDIEATSRGQMLAVRSDVQGSAGYVAMEKVVGTVHGRNGSFVFQHSGIMNRGAASLTLVIVPDSGTDQLTGISGTATIIVDGKAHSYELEYALPSAS